MWSEERRAGLGDIDALTGRPPKQDAVLAGQQMRLVTRGPPGAILDGRGLIGPVSPPLRTRGALGQHDAQDALDLDETQFKLSLPLTTQVPAQGIVLSHAKLWGIDPTTSNLNHRLGVKASLDVEGIFAVYIGLGGAIAIHAEPVPTIPRVAVSDEA